jgi:type IV pilus assembly protein PilQ
LKQATQAQEELEPLQVRYMRVSYARAAELRALVEEVVTERGSVAYDERTNQLIIKDIAKGLKNASVLVGKLDLRTPQVLIETQIVEANRSLVRDLGARFGFNFQRSPDFGNQTGWNFPNSIGVDGTTNDANNGINPSHPIINILLGSADGSKTITGALTAYEQEGRARIISRPAVSTTNNRQATIRSIQRVRVRTPAGGVSVATGSGAQAAGTSAIATEQIEVGIVLEVTPQASPDYYVLLDVNAKSSTLGQAGPDGIPIEIERSSTSSVLVSSGQTFAMGGIYKISDRDQLDGVPFFKDIPVLGTFFRTSRIDNSDEELIFFLTPRIIEGSFDDAAMKATT